MPEPAFDAPDSSPPLPPAVTGSTGKGDAPPKSLDDMTGSGDAQYDAITKADLALTTKKIGAEAGMEAQRKRSDDAYAARQERMLAQEGATMEDLKPWNAAKELNSRKTDLWEQFGSPGFIVAMLASTFTAMPMNSALNAGAAAMNAINQNDMDSYNKAFDAWKENSNLTIKRLDIEEHEFEQIDHLRTKNMESWRASASALAARFNDQRLQIMLANGYDQQALEARDALAKSKVELADATQRLQENEVRRQVFSAFLGDSKDPEKIKKAAHDSQALMYADFLSSPGAKTPQELAVASVITQPGFMELPGEEQTRRIVDAATTFQAKGLKAAEEIRERQVVKDGLRQKNPDWPADKLELETDKAMKEAKAPPVTGNKRVDMESHIGQYDDALKLIDGIDKTLNKYAGAAGVAGRATRLGEVVSNILGSNKSDRKQMMRDIEQLQIMAPRLLLDQKTGRPLSVEAGKISDVIAGLSLGDTTANTLRAMKELRERLSTIRDRDKAQLPGGTPAPAAAPADPDDRPWENDPLSH
jgi:hypothetical protein